METIKTSLGYALVVSLEFTLRAPLKYCGYYTEQGVDYEMYFDFVNEVLYACKVTVEV